MNAKTPWTWQQSPELMARLAAAQNKLVRPVDIMTFAGFCDSEAELAKHVEHYEAIVASPELNK